MANYKIEYAGDNKYYIYTGSSQDRKYFSGYTFMGGVIWANHRNENYAMDNDEAAAVLYDLIAADDDEEEVQVPETDELMEKFQRIIDAAVLDRDTFSQKWLELNVNGEINREVTRRAYVRYQQAQSYLEGIINAVSAAGYDIVTTVDSSKLTVTVAKRKANNAEQLEKMQLSTRTTEDLVRDFIRAGIERYVSKDHEKREKLTKDRELMADELMKRNPEVFKAWAESDEDDDTLFNYFNI